MKKLPSQFQIGDDVCVRFFETQGSGPVGGVTGVHFTASKVTYDIDLTLGGETLRNVDSTFVEGATKKKAVACGAKPAHKVKGGKTTSAKKAGSGTRGHWRSGKK